MTSIYLVRHGVTPANRENRFAGRTGEELHADGIAQVRQVGERLQGEKISAVYCGPARRTVQSAEMIASILAVPSSVQEEFDEINIPHWDGLTKDEIRQRYNDEYPTWLASPDSFRVEGCETLQQVQDRAVAGVSRLNADHDSENLLLVSHLIVLRCLVLHYRGLGIKEFRSIRIDNGSILRVRKAERGGMQVDLL